MRRYYLAGLWLIGNAWLPAGCAPASMPAAVRLEPADVALARHNYEGVLAKFSAYSDPVIQAYVQKVGARLAAGAPHTNFPMRFTVLDSPGIFAYSFAHGEIVISRGLLVHLNSEAQLAAVLAHEIGHVVSLHPLHQSQKNRNLRALEARLSGRLNSQQGRDTLNALSLARARGYSREYEIEADVWSERLLARAGYDVDAMAQILRFFMQQDAFWNKNGFELWELPEIGGGEGVFATHPSPAERLEQSIRRQGKAARADPAPDAAYLGALNGVIYGLPERYGIKRGSGYVHPGWRLAFTVPPNWYLFGTDDRLVAAARDRDGLLVMWMKPRENDEAPRRALEQLARGTPLASVAPHTGPGVTGETAITRFRENGEERTLRLAVLDIGERRMHVVGFTYLPAHWSEADNHFRALLQSVRLVPEGEARRAKPWRVRAVAPRKDGTITFAAESFSDHPREQWQLLNQAYPNGRLDTAPRIKTVE